MVYIVYIYGIYIYMVYMVFITEGFFEVAINLPSE